MTQDELRMEVLKQLEDGLIGTDEALRRLNEIAEGTADPRQTASESAAPGQDDRASGLSPDQAPSMRYWRQWWMIPMFVGITIILLASLMMYWAVQASGVGFWFLCAWFPMVLGLGITALAWTSRKARWIHVRVDTGEEEWPRRISISLPIPLGLVAWAVRTFGWRIPAMQRTVIDDLLVAMDDSSTPDAPIFIDVNEGEKGERVQVYIG
jgi:hypothetical protein